MHDGQQHVEHRGGVIGTADSGSVHGIVTGARRAQQPGVKPRGTKQVKAPVESRFGKRDSTAREQDVDFATIFLAPKVRGLDHLGHRSTDRGVRTS